MIDKYCIYCKKYGHDLSECSCTRPADWKPINEIENITNLANAIKLLKSEDKPFGYWHAGPSLEESEFFLAEDIPDNECKMCIPLYTRKQNAN